MKVSFNVKGYTDRRTSDLTERYARIEARRHVEPGRSVSMGSGVGALGSDGQGGRDRSAGPARIWPATAAAPFRVVSVRGLHDRRSTLRRLFEGAEVAR